MLTNRITVRRVLTITAFVMLSLLSACAGIPEKMTRAALTGDVAAIEGLVDPAGSPDVNTPFTLEESDPSCYGIKTLTPLQAAACAGHKAIVLRLITGKADIDLASGAGVAPIVLAAKKDHDGIVTVLVGAGASTESTDAAGNTPLMIIAAKGKRELAGLLLKNGASPKARNMAGETALLLSPDPELSKTLTELGADPLALTTAGMSGLHIAALKGNPETARFFLEHGVDPALKSERGLRALDVARGTPPKGPDGGVDRMLGAIQNARARSGEASDSGRVRRNSEVVAVIEEWVDRLVAADVAVGDRAAQEGRSADAMGIYTAALQKACGGSSKGEEALRVKIVSYAASLPQTFDLPEEAREHIARTSYLIKKNGDIGRIEDEMAEVLRIAPWWIEGYFNLGQIQAEQNKFADAERNLRIFISAAAPDDERTRTAQDRIYEIKMAREEDAKFRGLTGDWVDAKGAFYHILVSGDQLTISPRLGQGLSIKVNNRNGVLEGTVEGASYQEKNKCLIPGQTHPVTGKISPDMDAISLDYLWSSYKTSVHWENLGGNPVQRDCLTCSVVCDAVTVSGTKKVHLALKPAKDVGRKTR